MKQKLTNSDLNILQDFCDNHDYELREDYSGRYMYGRSCIGFVADCSGFEVAMNLASFLTEMEEDDLLAAFQNTGVRSDQMGLSYIFYFPNMCAVEAEEEVE